MIKFLLHFMACYLVADFTFNLLPVIGTDPYWQYVAPRIIAVSIAFLVGIGKELWDKYHDHENISAGDLTIDAFGALAWMFLPLIAEILPWIPQTSPLLNW